MNFYDINRRLEQYKVRDYMKDATSGTPTVGVHEKNLPHDLMPLSFKDMMRYATPDYEAPSEEMHSMQINNLQGYGGESQQITHLTAGIRPQYEIN